MGVADAVSQRSRCTRAQCGAVVVDATNRVIATGYNGQPAGTNLSCVDCPRSRLGPTPETITTYDDCSAIHAEANALLFCDRREREGGTLYVTTNVCFTCAKLVANSGVSRVVQRTDAEYRDVQRSVLFMVSCGLEVDTWRT